jgi:hypothetical protein
VDASGYVDVARSNVHLHFQPSCAAVAAGSTNDHVPTKASPYENSAFPASYVASATDAQCFGALFSSFGGNC